ncbi:ras-related GTP-binding protein C-like isoform X1 [Varroa jacobsoni]|uniref:ras-related GTP-binding protein C-like isoform X1 n=1 Tax=Varroa jacobsoni TaxID=62625 RepID=UPI000BF91EF0|nr:ras-related GTP-binding protein C-like isoform X1 [Varroa jacobsoni]
MIGSIIFFFYMSAELPVAAERCQVTMRRVYKSYQAEDLSIAGSFPRDFQYGDTEADARGGERGSGSGQPKILLMGHTRSGKSSIIEVVFHKMNSTETLYLESNNDIKKEFIKNSPFVQLEIWDIFGAIDLKDEKNASLFEDCDGIVFVIDAQNELSEVKEAVNTMLLAVDKAHRLNPNVNIDVFIHKVDGLSDDQKIETQREVQSQIESATDNLSAQVALNLTSIYDHSVFEAFSKCVQRLIPQLPMLENLLNVFISNSLVERGFLFDLPSKIYIATDVFPVDMQLYELCCDMLDLATDISTIYGRPGSQFDQQAGSLVRLSNETVLYLREVGQDLALVCIIRMDNFKNHGLIDYNFDGFKQGVTQLFRLRSKENSTATPDTSNLSNNLETSNNVYLSPATPPNTVA